MSSTPIPIAQAPVDDGRTLSFLSGNLAQVDVAKIERELNRLWESANRVPGMAEDGAKNGAEDGADDKQAWKPVIRSCALNMVLLCEEENENKFEGLLADITVRHPCRAILAVIASAPLEKVEAWVTAHCHFLPGRLDKQMCCEQITVKWSGSSFESVGLASVVTPLVIPELPSWLFAGCKELTNAIVEPFLSYLDRLLIDSRLSQDDLDAKSNCINLDAAARLRSKWQIALDLADRAIVLDLAWLTLVAWRKAVALAFDNTDVSIPPARLKAIKTVTIEYGGQGAGFSQALLFGCWLSSRLKLKAQSVATDSALKVVFNDTAVSAMTVIFKPNESSSSVGVNSFEMTFVDGPDTLNVNFDGGALKVVNGDSEEFMELPWSSAREKSDDEPVFTELVDFAVQHSGKDFVYLAAAKSAIELLSLLKN